MCLRKYVPVHSVHRLHYEYFTISVALYITISSLPPPPLSLSQSPRFLHVFLTRFRHLNDFFYILLTSISIDILSFFHGTFSLPSSAVWNFIILTLILFIFCLKNIWFLFARCLSVHFATFLSSLSWFCFHLYLCYLQFSHSKLRSFVLYWINLLRYIIAFLSHHHPCTCCLMLIKWSHFMLIPFMIIILYVPQSCRSNNNLLFTTLIIIYF